jgi:hypothetical protein
MQVIAGCATVTDASTDAITHGGRSGVRTCNSFTLLIEQSGFTE